MSLVDQLIKTLKAAAYEKGVPALAEAAEMSDDTVRRILSDKPPESLKKLRRLELAAADPAVVRKTAADGVES